MPRWFGLIFRPNSCDTDVRISIAAAPSGRISTAFRTASRTATLPICLPPRALGLSTGRCCRGRASPSAPCSQPPSAQFREHAFRDLQLTQLLRQPSPFRVEPGTPSETCCLSCPIVKCRHLHFPSGNRHRPYTTIGGYCLTDRELMHAAAHRESLLRAERELLSIGFAGTSAP